MKAFLNSIFASADPRDSWARGSIWASSASGLLIALVAALLHATAVSAQDAPSTEDLVNRLKPAQQPKTRGFVVPSRGVTVEGGKTAPAEPPSVDLAVNFEFNSATLTTDAMLTLDNLGRALKNPALAAFRFEIAGHTDAVGGDAFNQSLSERRAMAVKVYLVAHDGVDGKRLETIGYGRSRLLDKDHPNAAVNRRVQVTNLGE
jgi:outer membrane protein OmpA-like peptidoglycan-associated protein